MSDTSNSSTAIAPIPAPTVDPNNTEMVFAGDGSPGATEITSPVLLEQLLDARVQAIRMFTFMGYMIMSTNFLQSEVIPTACATIIGKHNTIIINPNFFSSILKTAEERVFVLMHELMHLFLYHIGRQTENCYNPMLWNISTDYMINAFIYHMNKDIRQNNIDRIKMPEFCLFDDRFYKMSADDIYHLILKENNGDANKAVAKHGGMGDIRVVMQGGGKGQPTQMPMDDVSTTPMSTAEKTALNRTISASISSQKNRDMKEMGTAMGDLFRLFSEYTQEKVDWKDVLREYIVTASKQRNTYNRYNRRSGATVVFPAMTGDHINVVFGADTSGSMSDTDLGEVRNELRNIMANFESWEIDCVTCDTNVNSMGHYSTENGDTFDNVTASMKGGGGTDMNPIVEYANSGGEFMNVDGDIVTIIVTDGYMPDITAEPEHPTIVVLTTNGASTFKTANEDIAVIKMEK